MLVMTFLLLLYLKKIFKDEDKSAFTVAIIYIWLFSYSAVRSILVFDILGLQFYRHRYFIVIWLILLMIISLIIRKKKMNYKSVGRFLTILVSLLILLSFYQGGKHLFSKEIHEIISEKKTMEKMSLPRRDSLPDIYYIILDAYTGQKGLKKYLDFNNGEFITFLKSRGFYVAEKSKSNYSWTVLSLASSLNMEYNPVDTLKNENIFQIKEHFTPTEAIMNNKFYALLNTVGYQFEDISIWWGTSLHFSNPRLYYSQFITNNFNLALIQMTFLDRPLVGNYFMASAKRSIVRTKLNLLNNLKPTGRPRFVYAHFLIPHHPYVFSKDGSATGIMDGVLEIGSEQKLYLDQLQYANSEIEKTIDILLAQKSREKPIIILQGDHGAYNLGKTKEENINLRMSILNAYYVPDTCRRNLYPEISPVNSFRIILNFCFKQNYKLLPDKSYYSTFEEYAKLKDVTTQVNSAF